MAYLHVYLAPSGQWSGIIMTEDARIAGCASPDEVWAAAQEQFPLDDLGELPGGLALAERFEEMGHVELADDAKKFVRALDTNYAM